MKICGSTSLQLQLISALFWLGGQAFAPRSRGVTCRSSVAERLCSTSEIRASQNTRLQASVTNLQVEDNPVLKTLESLQSVANEYAESFGLGPAEAAFYGLFLSLRQSGLALGLKGSPFLLKRASIEAALRQPTQWPEFFNMEDLERAVTDDFLDAARGSTDNRKGWKITDVSVPRGESFEEARMTFEDVQAALEKGTVILNAAGAHIPKLAGPSLAVTDATALPCALNLYVTAAGKRTSAPPHTDRQDVCVVQTTGAKSWKVFSPPDPSLKPSADIFARGKGDDSLPLYALSETATLLLETTLHPGDVLFIPAGFPHTTSTVVADDDSSNETSIHLTLGIDHHIWELDYLSVRRLAYRRACVNDATLGDETNPYTGAVNQLPASVFVDVMSELPLGFLEDEGSAMVEQVANEAAAIALQIDPNCKVDAATWRDTVERVQRQGVELLDIHRNMYLAALEEGRVREAEAAMTAHLEKRPSAMTPVRMQRLSLFRVRRYYDQINDCKQRLKEWSFAGAASVSATSDGSAPALAADWALNLPVSVGDQVEADLGGAFFPATITRASDGTYDVSFFDGDRETGLARNQIKLLSPPKAAASSDEVDTSKLTPKQFKRWTKEQEAKLQKKGL